MTSLIDYMVAMNMSVKQKAAHNKPFEWLTIYIPAGVAYHYNYIEMYLVGNIRQFGGDEEVLSLAHSLFEALLQSLSNFCLIAVNVCTV